MDLNADMGDPRIDARKGVVFANVTTDVGSPWRIELRDYYNVTIAAKSDTGTGSIAYEVPARMPVFMFVSTTTPMTVSVTLRTATSTGAPTDSLVEFVRKWFRQLLFAAAAAVTVVTLFFVLVSSYV